ncbi:MAG: hypothetical protein HOE90_13495 [Bacteriovoracaceae bacterium]|jgi:hypothetical protein|nr:hypothetical protein [Bacteriovoracaceae bacterium]
MFIRIRPVSWSILLFLASFSFNLRAETLELRSYTDKGIKWNHQYSISSSICKAKSKKPKVFGNSVCKQINKYVKTLSIGGLASPEQRERDLIYYQFVWKKKSYFAPLEPEKICSIDVKLKKLNCKDQKLSDISKLVRILLLEQV